MGEGVEEWAAAERTRRAEKKRRRPTFATEKTGEEEAFRKDCAILRVWPVSSPSISDKKWQNQTFSS